MSTESGTPALTPEEWKRFGFHGRAIDAERFRDLFVGRPTGNIGVKLKNDVWASDTASDAHKLAALCLYQQPFGFTQEDVVNLRREALEIRRRIERFEERSWDRDLEKMWDSLADRIANLLPPAP